MVIFLQTTISLPIYYDLDVEKQKYISNCIKEFFEIKLSVYSYLLCHLIGLIKFFETFEHIFNKFHFF